MKAERVVMLCSTCCLVIATSAGQALGDLPPGYTLTDLGTLGGAAGNYTVHDRMARGINNKGEVAGYWYDPGNHVHAFLWLPQAAYGLPAGMNDLGARPGYGSDSRAYAINDSGRVACVAGGACYWNNGFWSGGGGADTQANGINNSGRIAGMAKVDFVNEYHAYLWAPTEDLGDIGGRGFANARDINDDGVVVGCAKSNAPGVDTWAFLLEGTTVTWLGTFAGGGNSYAFGLNELRQVVGYAEYASGPRHAFLWLPEPAYGLPAGMNDLGALGPGESKCYGGINNSGQVVGYSDTGTPSEHAFIWDEGTMYDLNDLIPADSGWRLEQAGDINDLGQIVGRGTHDGELTVFLLTPIPEPATLALLALGGVGALLRGRRRGRR